MNVQQSEELSRLIKYPEDWDTTAYPTLYEALHELCTSVEPADDKTHLPASRALHESAIADDEPHIHNAGAPVYFWRAGWNAYRDQLALKDGWLQAAIAWSVCRSIHAAYGRRKDPFYTTRQQDFLKHEQDARKIAREIRNHSDEELPDE